MAKSGAKSRNESLRPAEVRALTDAILIECIPDYRPPPAGEIEGDDFLDADAGLPKIQLE